MLFSLSLLPPILISYFESDGLTRAFGSAYLIIILSGMLLWISSPTKKMDIKLHDGYIIVVMFWLVLGVTGALPFFMTLDISFTNALFESLSGLTTTGATVLTQLDTLPKSILYYRQQLQWLGGMGIIVLAVAILPMLGIGGMQLYRAETPGPIKDNKLTPRITETAKALWFIYLGLTVLCALAYYASGMSLFDAITHSYSTIAIGGFSTHDASIGYFNSTAIELVCIIFMTIAGINFSLHFLAWNNKSVWGYIKDSEFKAYLFILFFVSALTFLTLYFNNLYSGIESLRHGVFQAVSISTTSGFITDNFTAWPSFAVSLLLLASFAGGCAGSTGGGLKVIRVLSLFRQGLREIFLLIHPNAQVSVKIGDKALSPAIIKAIWGFFSLYIVSFCIMSLILTATGLDILTALSAVAACMNNLGPGLGEVSTNYANINDSAKWVLSFAMLLGRLELFTLLVLFTPWFWRR